MAEDKVFTQDEVNKLVGEARAQGREQGRKEFEGWVSPEALNTKVTEISDQVKALTADKEAQAQQIQDAETKIAQHVATIETLKKQVADLKAEVKELAGQPAPMTDGAAGVPQDNGTGEAPKVRQKRITRDNMTYEHCREVATEGK